MKCLKTVNDHYLDFLENGKEEDEVIYFLKITITLKDLKEYVDLFAKHLICMGVEKGDRIACSMPSRPECYYIILAASRIGATVLLLFHMIPDSVKAKILIDLDISLMITINDMIKSIRLAAKNLKGNFKMATIDGNSQGYYSFTKKIDDKINYEDFILNDISEDLPLLLSSTSGTIDEPKFVCMTQGNVANQIKIAKNFFNFSSEKSKIPIAVAFPLSTPGIITSMGFLFATVSQIFTQDPGAIRFLDLVYERKAKYMAAPPSFFENILSINDDLDRNYESVRGVITGMDFFNISLIKRLKVKFRNIDSFGNGYGLAETCNIVMSCNIYGKENIEDYPTNIMKLIENVDNAIEVRDKNMNKVGIGEIGELYIKGKSVVNGYIGGKNNENFVNGWLRTRDVVKLEAGNRVMLLGRDKHLIKRSGKCVSPIIVQNTINDIPGVLSSCVVGVPYKINREMIWVFVVKKAKDSVRIKDIMKHCRENLVNYMIPDRISFISEFPKSGDVGKIDFIKLKEFAKNELEEFEIGGL
jgi:acyl-coenzyme A synthetase/AMP-(fatty) acid ligase